MSCIFCDTSLEARYLYCSACERDRLEQLVSDVSEFPKEGHLLARIIKNNYEILGQDYKDALGFYYKSVYIAKGRTDRIYVLPLDFTRDDSLTQAFHQRVKKWAPLKYKKVLKPIASGRQGKLHFSVNIFPHGLRLSKILTEGLDLPLKWSLKILLATCSMLKQCHHHNLIHANLKPSSIYVTREGKVQLTNIGLLDPLPIELFKGHVPADVSLYASPEQLNSQKAGIQSDFYSLALVSYRLLTGINPFETEKEVNILYKNLHESVIPALALNSEIPVEVSDVITRNLHKKANDRSLSIEEIIAIFNQQDDDTETKPLPETTDHIPPEDRNASIQEGKEFFRKGQLKKAIECWQNYLQSDSSNFAVQKYKYFAEERLKSKETSPGRRLKK